MTKEMMSVVSILLGFLNGNFAVLAGETFCPKAGIGASTSDRPKMIVNVPGGRKLLVCGYSEGGGEREVFSEFDIYAVKDGRSSESLFRASALDSYRIKRVKAGVILEEFTRIKTELASLYETDVFCTVKECKRFLPRCVYKKRAPVDSDAVALAKTYLKGKNSDRFPDESIIGELMVAALTGDSEAIKLFEKNPGFKLDGAASETYDEGVEMIARMKKDGCL